MLIIRPSFEHLGAVALLPVVCAFGVAVFALMTRVLAHREDPWAMQLQTAFWGAVVCGILLFFGNGTGSDLIDPVWPDTRGFAMTLGVGIAASVSGMFAVYAYRDAPASTLAPLQYFEIVCATFFGWFIFGEFPDALTWTGIAIIIASGLFILWRERQVARRRAVEEPLVNP
ncbi:drug/metabolite transporter (DMT)-like permease [Gellertiella hungarica]|uniref:Drug/metabolite transporter (DMT)-like permease n=1 Tax=Gellertiella hungarica TaxID=1572859 RepID=A0A7W6J2D8_9HYPH|nr:drug/metabolite transporter (DMT)-like permease [Gellertiella hungarica]